MKKNLKKWILAIACVITLGATAYADNEKPIGIGQLPATAQQLIRKNFSKHKVALAKVESSLVEKSYDVIFTNGDKVEFDRSGNWTEVSCKTSGVPAAVIPAAIASYVSKNYAGSRIIQIERDRKEYDVTLSNGMEITFNAKFQVTDIDN